MIGEPGSIRWRRGGFASAPEEPPPLLDIYTFEMYRVVYLVFTVSRVSFKPVPFHGSPGHGAGIEILLQNNTRRKAPAFLQ
jgi:hypothetical protein